MPAHPRPKMAYRNEIKIVKELCPRNHSFSMGLCHFSLIAHVLSRKLANYYFLRQSACSVLTAMAVSISNSLVKIFFGAVFQLWEEATWWQ
jgi:hypothetical protein